jgi:hypothetical protein
VVPHIADHDLSHFFLASTGVVHADSTILVATHQDAVIDLEVEASCLPVRCDRNDLFGFSDVVQLDLVITAGDCALEVCVHHRRGNYCMS